MNRIFTVLIVVISLFVLTAQQPHPFYSTDFQTQDQWIDSVYNGMSQRERIGQLFMAVAHSNKNLAHENKLYGLIEEYHIGGLLFTNGNVKRQAELTNMYQELTKTQLLIAMDAEWDLGKQLKNAHQYPWNMTLGAVDNDTLIQQIGTQIGKHCKRLGVHVNFAPEVTISTKSNTQLIGQNSYGADKVNVTKKVLAFTKGLQSTGIIAAAKHFDSYESTVANPQLALSVADAQEQLPDSIQLYPYQRLIEEKLGGILVAERKLSDIPVAYNVVTEKLKDKFGFQGLIFADLKTTTTPEASALASFQAGSDVLILSKNIANTIKTFESALNDGTLDEKRLEYSVKKLLRAKHIKKLKTYQAVKVDSLATDLHTLKDDLLRRKVIKNAITAVKVSDNTLPIKKLDTQRIAYIAMGDASGKQYISTLRKYANVDVFKEKNLADLTRKLKSYAIVVIGFHKSDANPAKEYKFTNKEVVWLEEIARTNNVILNVFANPYCLQDIKTFENIDNIIVSYQNSAEIQEISAQMLFGALPTLGKLPIAVKEEFTIGTGEITNTLPRLGYDLPENVGMSSAKLNRIDSLAKLVVSKKMAPGVQLLVARKGKIIYNKNFGYHTYDKKKPVRDIDIYDVASMTKILATLPLIMQLEEAKEITLKSKLKELLPKFKGTNKEKLTILEVLSHYGRLKPWIPFYVHTLDSVTKKPDSLWYSDSLTKKYTIKVADQLYLNEEYKDSIMQRIIDSDLLPRRYYKYSDLPYYILKEYLETHYKSNLNKLTQRYFYKSLGAHYTTYNPLEKFGKYMIVPSEEDDYYRNQTLQGYVHDMGAAMQGGIGGHAGLFSNANDVAKIMQMYIQGGVYGDKKYFDNATIAKFNKCHYCHKDVRRGVGFDKPQLHDVGPTCGCVSMNSFGHSGFTGTYTWADPDEEIVYVFLSNRTYPTMDNRKLIKTDIRTKIQKLIYEAIEN